MTDGEFFDALKRERIKHGLEPQTGKPKAMLPVLGYAATAHGEAWIIVGLNPRYEQLVDALASWASNPDLSFTDDDAERFLDGVEM